MAKRELHRSHIQVPLRSPRRRGRKLVIRQEKDQTTPAHKGGQNKVESGEDSRISTSSSLVSATQRLRRQRAWRWSLLWLSILCILGGTLVSGLLFLTKLPPPIDCQNISPLSADGNRLYCAQQAAASGKLDQLVEAIKLVQHWSPDHPLNAEAQRMMKEWSGAILDLAQQQLNQGNQSEAVAIASKIPVNSPLYAEAQAAISSWKEDWKNGENILSQFKDAIAKQKWQLAFKSIVKLSQIKWDYWRNDRVDALMKQLTTERDAWQQLEEARQLAKVKTPDQLEAAIALAAKIDPNTYVKPIAKDEISQWSQNLLEIAATLFDNQDFAGVVSVAERVPITTPQYSEAQDWIRLGRAWETVKKDNILAFVDALSAVRQIGAKSPVHKLVSDQTTVWEKELQDRLQLKFAATFANFEQHTGLTWAIDQASRVKPDSPQRRAAQTLIAQWHKEIQQIEDKNKLRDAQQLAKDGTLEDLKAAVAMANEIHLGQPLRIDAQTEIAKWNKQIQTLEDKPILELAETLALRRDLMAAIATAGQIRPNRALYEAAQEAIAKWIAQVQIAQDRPILEAAAALAAQGRFEAAIATASQIPPERALYKQAQAAIERWTEQSAAFNSPPPSVPIDHD